MKIALKFLFATIFVWMIAVTIRTGLTISLWDAWDSFGDNPWATATLYDAYFAFITFWVWVAYRETAMGARILWLILILCLGSIAMSFYVLVRLFRLKPEQSAEAILLR